MPCAADKSSIATMVAAFSAMSPSRRAAKVAIDTWSSWLAEVGSESTLAGCASDLVLRGERRRRHVRDHEAGIEPAFGDEEGRQAAHRWIDQQRDAALGQRADLGDGEGQAVGGERHRLGVEIAARERSRPSSAKTSGLSETALASTQEHAGGVAQQVEHGAHHLRLAAQGIGVLHLVALDMASARIALPASSPR